MTAEIAKFAYCVLDVSCLALRSIVSSHKHKVELSLFSGWAFPFAVCEIDATTMLVHGRPLPVIRR